MLKRLKKKYIMLASVLMVCLMAVLLVIMNTLNYISLVSESDIVLDTLSKPDAPFLNEEAFKNFKAKDIVDIIPQGMSPEIPYESRYFSTIVLEDGSITEPNISRIISVTEETAKEYTEMVIADKRDSGFIYKYRFKKIEDNGVTRVVFLDCGRKIDAFYRFLWISISVGVFGCITVFILLLLGAGRIIRPIAESYAKQKRFISDAGHEIKTPLTIINANLDLLEDDCGTSEEFSDIRQQTERLKQLTNNLVFLSRMEETETPLSKSRFDISTTVHDAAKIFTPLAEAQKKEYILKIEPGIACVGAQESLKQLTSVLVDNAFKYSPVGGIVTVELYRNKNNVVLSVFNTTTEKINADVLPMIFERFYRTDASRNSETGGSGIGLSMAKAIVDAHAGAIYAETKNGFDFRITAAIPVN